MSISSRDCKIERLWQFDVMMLLLEEVSNPPLPIPGIRFLMILSSQPGAWWRGATGFGSLNSPLSEPSLILLFFEVLTIAISFPLIAFGFNTPQIWPIFCCSNTICWFFVLILLLCLLHFPPLPYFHHFCMGLIVCKGNYPIQNTCLSVHKSHYRPVLIICHLFQSITRINFLFFGKNQRNGPEYLWQCHNRY